MRSRSRLADALVTVVAVLLPVASHADGTMREARGARAADSVVDDKGDIRVPRHYRKEYQYIGTWAVAADHGPGSKQLHVVFASPGAVEAYRRAGHFPDGTVLVKEVFDAKTASMTTGKVSHPETLKGWFVMVRDHSDHHPGNPLWGDGWGWSWFDAHSPTRTTSTDYKTNCRGCHVPAQASEWVYVDGYAPLRR